MAAPTDSVVSNIFSGCVFTLGGFLSRSDFELRSIIRTHAGQLSYGITSKTTHLITTDKEVEGKAYKVACAISKGIFIVYERFLDESITAGKRLREEDFTLQGTPFPSAPPVIKPTQAKPPPKSFLKLSFSETDNLVSSESTTAPESASFTATTSPPPLDFTPQTIITEPSRASDPSGLRPSTNSINSRYLGLLTSAQLELKNTEDHYRELYAQQRDSAELADPHLLLLDVFKHRSTFTFEAEDEGEAAIPKVLDQYRNASQRTAGTPSVVSRDQFLTNWSRFTRDMFRGLDWRGIFVAGGSVLACLDPAFNDDDPATAKDIDVFIYTDSESEANQRLKHIYEVVKRNSGSKGDVIRTKNAVTLLGTYPYRHVQVILRLYKSPAEVLMGFDIDCCTVGFDGTTVWALPRARRAINKRYNLVDLSRRSLTYEVRLHKYAKRGFAVMVPGLDRSRIDPALYRKKARDVCGLAKLLLFEAGALKRLSSGRPSPAKKGKPPAAGSPALPRTDPPADDEEAAASDYSEVSIPWGPQENVQHIIDALNTRDKAQFFAQLRRIKREHQEKKKVGHIFVSGGIDKVLEDTERMGPLSWLKDNPGRQLLTGSFHPVDDDHWEVDAYPATDGPAGDALPAKPPAKKRARSAAPSLPREQAAASSNAAATPPPTTTTALSTAATTSTTTTTAVAAPAKHIAKRQPALPPQVQPPETTAASTTSSVFGPQDPPTSAYAKLLLLVSMLGKSGKLTIGEKSKVKDLIIANNPNVLAALEAFEADNDLDELADTLRSITRL